MKFWVVGIEFDRCELVAIPRKNDDIGNRVESTQKRGLFRRKSRPRIGKSVVCPKRCKRNGGNDEFKGACSVYLDVRRPFLSKYERIKIVIVLPCAANCTKLRVVHFQEVYGK